MSMLQFSHIRWPRRMTGYRLTTNWVLAERGFIKDTASQSDTFSMSRCPNPRHSQPEIKQHQRASVYISQHSGFPSSQQRESCSWRQCSTCCRLVFIIFFLSLRARKNVVWTTLYTSHNIIYNNVAPTTYNRTPLWANQKSLQLIYLLRLTQPPFSHW